jgi:LacI family transcriptional regulator
LRGKFGIDSRPEWLVMRGGGIEGGYSSMSRILSLRERPSAVITCDDTLALGAIRAIAQAGLRIPEDMSVVGFDDIPMAQYSNPPLTTLRMPVKEISRRACDVLLKLISGRMAFKSTVIRVAPELVVRSSTGPWRNHTQRKR